MDWKFESGKPIWQQVCDRVRRDVAVGVYRPGEKLPGVRDFAFAAEVNPNTMQRALTELEEEGLLFTRGTSGRFVCEDPARIRAAKEQLLREAAEAYLAICARLGVGRDEAADILKGVKDEHE